MVLSSGGTISLITGIPRSGTTLCCHILNQQQDYVALHEPFRPDNFEPNKENILAQVKQRATEVQNAIIAGLPFEHGHKRGLDIDNPIGMEQKDGKRQSVAQRGEITLSLYKGREFCLVIKQNAFFTAYLQELTAHFDVLSIVRNPIDVLLSWWTVNLPVSRGQLPAGQQHNAALKLALSQQSSTLERQICIYQWFIHQFVQAKTRIVKYEDIVSSNGMALCEHYGISSPVLSARSQPERQYSPEILERLEHAQSKILAIDCSGLYSHDYLSSKIRSYLSQRA
ncbi:sulfotransferase domain-containing protein [Glaciecola siphonariae]|uniref:Sulfotransferase domain-containing protein n=1 Tax=Glaciecola siphonariae TaxID=521012 RepID=A0ABV9LV40_9ALTE